MPWQQPAGCLPPSSTRQSLALPCVLQCNPFVRGTMEDGTTPVLRSGGGGTAGRDLQFYNNKAYLVTTQSVSPVAICTNTADVSPRARCCPRSGHSHGRAGNQRESRGLPLLRASRRPPCFPPCLCCASCNPSSRVGHLGAPEVELYGSHVYQPALPTQPARASRKASVLTTQGLRVRVPV